MTYLFDAEIQSLPADIGARSAPIFPKYRPNIVFGLPKKFGSESYYTNSKRVQFDSNDSERYKAENAIAELTFQDPCIFPGERAKVRVELLYYENVLDYLRVNEVFILREGSKISAFGKIKGVIGLSNGENHE